MSAVPAAIPVGRAVTKTVEKRRARDLKTRANVRKTFPPESELRELGRSVIRRQIHPLIILRDTILDGECRWRGVMLENPDWMLDVIGVDREMTPAEVCELQLVSALHSTSLTSYDQALACKEWLEQNRSATFADLAQKINRDPSMVSTLMTLWKGTDPVIKAAQEGKIGPNVWQKITALPSGEQGELLEMYLAGTPASQIAEISRGRRNGSSNGHRTRSKLPLLSGVDLTVAGELSAAGLKEAARDILKLADEVEDLEAMNKILKAAREAAVPDTDALCRFLQANKGKPVEAICASLKAKKDVDGAGIAIGTLAAVAKRRKGKKGAANVG